MTESTAFNSLKHGAFSEVLILPGEDPAAFEELKQRLFAEYNVSGCSEESTMTSIAKTMWQLRTVGPFMNTSSSYAHRVPIRRLPTD